MGYVARAILRGTTLTYTIGIAHSLTSSLTDKEVFFE